MAKLRNLHKLRDPDILAKNLVEGWRTARGLYWNIARPEMPDPVFVIGCSRSGTTLTFETLAASGRFRHFGYEIPQFWDRLHGPLNNGWSSEAAGAEDAQPGHRAAAQRYFFERLGTGQVLEKTCINTMRVGYLDRLFPNARFVFIHRDGRDNISSMMDGWRHGRTDGGFGLQQFFGTSPDPVAINGGEFREWHFFLPPGWRDYNHASLEEVCAYQWITANALALEARSHIPESRWIQVRYEDVFERPVEMFAHVFDRLDIPFDDALRTRCRSLSARPTSIVKGLPQRQKWKSNNPGAIERIEAQITPMMDRLGYGHD
ncbi:MAG: sulfotransferase [Casimicrobiaceae bacterium]